jgi:hypothetical protein
MRGAGMVGIALAAALASSVSSAAEAPRPLSDTEVKALSPADQIKLAVEQIASFVEAVPSKSYNAKRVAAALKLDAPPPAPAVLAAAVREKLAGLVVDVAATNFVFKDKGATRQPLRRIDLWTKPHATAVSSLCGSEEVMLDFHWNPKADADTQVTMRDLTVFLKYYALKSPASPVAAPVAPAELKALETACQTLNPRTQDSLDAFDAPGAWRGLWFKNQIDAALKQTVLPFDLACADGTQADQCRQTFEGYMKDFSDVRGCDVRACTLGINHGFRDAVATLDPGPLPKVRNVTLTQILPPMPNPNP